MLRDASSGLLTKKVILHIESVIILCTAKLRTIAELAVVAYTLQGLRGFVANSQGVGVQFEKPYIAAARAAFQDPRQDHRCKSLRVLWLGPPQPLSFNFRAQLKTPKVAAAVSCSHDAPRASRKVLYVCVYIYIHRERDVYIYIYI